MPAWLALALLAIPAAVMIFVGLLTAIRGWTPIAGLRNPRSAGTYLLVIGSAWALGDGGYAVGLTVAGSPLAVELHLVPVVFLVFFVLQMATFLAGFILVVAMEMRRRDRKAGS